MTSHPLNQKNKRLDRTKSQNKSKDKGKDKGKDASNSRLLEIEEDIATVAKIFVEKHSSSNLDACTEKLEKLGWGIFDPRYTTVVALFGEGVDKRHVWLTIDPTICENWVKTVGAHYGMFR